MKKNSVLSLIVLASLIASPLSVFAQTDLIQTNVSAGARAEVKRDNVRANNNDRGPMTNTGIKAMVGWVLSSNVSGTVTAIDGTTITVKARDGAVYTVDASNAVIRRNGSNAYLSGIEAGDVIAVQGAVNGSAVVATTIVTAQLGAKLEAFASSITGAIGTVTAIDGAVVTIKTKDGKTYTVQTANATVWKNNAKATVGDIKTGDSLIIQGAVSSTTITATRILVVDLVARAEAANKVVGTVTAIDGTTITMKTAVGTTYTVQAKDASVTNGDGKKNDKRIKVSKIAVGDTISVKGDIEGTTIQANAIVDGNARAGLFARVGGFFRNLFGKSKIEVNN